ncbi:MAG: metallophosphoesterase [Nanoarchaeota archaeon]|nr:metallophosphoesterase [Nanoarchaeota archaeon]MBU0978152.1 metallophosphoesterase [Nanoarchaeota archaeon]
MIKHVGRCLYIESKGKKILVIGDLHLGFEEALNNTGIFVSRTMFKEMINYLVGVFEEIGNVDEVVLLGDVKHTFGSVLKQEWGDVLRLFDFLEERGKKIFVVKGNHDVILRPIVKKKDVFLVDYYIAGGFCFLHGDRDFAENYDKKIKYWVVGHGHPAVKIGNGVKVEKYKAFLMGKHLGKKIILVPSFFDCNLGSDPRENNLGYAWKFNLNKFNVFVVQDDSLDVLDFGLLSRLP